MISRLFGAGFLLVCSACSRPIESAIAPDTKDASPQVGQATPAPATPPSAGDDDVREATFRWMFKKNASGMQLGAKVFCIHFEKGADPPPAFVARFASNKIPVVAGSGCTEDARTGVTQRSTGAHGLAFRIDSIKLTDADHATVTGGYYEAGLSASGNVYTLERVAGAWTVTKDEMTWIS